MVCSVAKFLFRVWALCSFGFFLSWVHCLNSASPCFACLLPGISADAYSIFSCGIGYQNLSLGRFCSVVCSFFYKLLLRVTPIQLAPILITSIATHYLYHYPSPHAIQKKLPPTTGLLGLGELECPPGSAIAGCSADTKGCKQKCPGFENAKCYFNTCSDPLLKGKKVKGASICAPVYFDKNDKVIKNCLNLGGKG